MADGITTRIEGLGDLKIAIEALKTDLRKRVVRGALRDAAKPMLNHARANAPSLQRNARYRTPGLLKRSIKVFASRQFNGRDGTLGVYIAVRGNRKALRASGGRGAKNPNDPFYWWWQEFGFTAVGRRAIRGGQRNRSLRRAERIQQGSGRKIPGKHFLSNAFRFTSGIAVTIFQARIKTRIDEANRRR